MYGVGMRWEWVRWKKEECERERMDTQMLKGCVCLLISAVTGVNDVPV